MSCALDLTKACLLCMRWPKAFFVRWWSEQPDAIKAGVKKLVQSGQLEFINGGYVQHDEAAAHYVAMIDQTTRGHR